MNRKRMMLCLAAAVMTSFGIQAEAGKIPLQLPRPDGKPGDSKKPVKVYFLAGQSNMVGMGDISGASPEHPSVFLSADPAFLPGEMPIGSSRKRAACKWYYSGQSGLAAHGVYQSADAKSAKGAVVALYPGVYDPKADYAKLTPVKTATVALGTVTATLPALEGPCTPVVSAFIDVPASGTYTVHAGFGDSTDAVAVLDGKEVYRKDPGGKVVVTKISLEAAKRYPLQITYGKSGSAAFWLEQVDLAGKGDLEILTKKDKKFPYLVDNAGNWTLRNDVYFQEARLSEGGKGCPLSALSNSKCLPKCRSIGPEVGFGYVMGTFHDEQVLLIKTAQGNRSLGSDFRPPSSGPLDPANKFEGEEYRLMVKGVHETLDNIAKIVPGYQGQGYEMAGFGWFQGHKDSGSTKEEYEKNLVNLINDLRKEFHAPKMPVVVATVGFHGFRLMQGPWKGVWAAQMAVGDPQQHPELAGTVASVDTRDFWREVEESPHAQDYHYNRNPETYLLVGEAMGRAMVRLQGGEAESIPKSDREARVVAEMAAEAATAAPTEAQIAAARMTLQPMLLDGLLEKFISNPRNQSAVREAVKGTKKPAGLDDVLDEAVAYYQAAGVHEYDWKPFGSNLKDATWDTFSFDLTNSPYKAKSAASAAGPEDGNAPEGEDASAAKGKGKGKSTNDAKAPAFVFTVPAGLTNWFMTTYDAKAAGWQSAPAPFGVRLEEMTPSNIAWLAKYPEYPLKRPMAKTICEKDVLLLRGCFEFPPVKAGYRYRIRVDGSIHENPGEGYAIYINGKLLAEQKEGVLNFRAQGLRGSPVWDDFRDEFKGGKVTIAVANFPMNNWNASFMPFRAPLRVWVEEMKIPPVE